MAVGLYALGILVAAVGVAVVGFGIPINEFSLGNTLIIAGSSGIVGGLVIIGLASVVRQLKRIAEALSARQTAGSPVAPRMMRPLEPQEPGAPTVKPARVPFPVKPRPEQRDHRAELPRDPRPPEPRATSNEIEPPEEAIIERPLPGFLPVSRTSGEALADADDEAPLSPRPSLRPSPPSSFSDELSEAPVERRSWPPLTSPDRTRSDIAADRGRSTETVARASSASRSASNGMFDSVWPAGRAGNKNPTEGFAKDEPRRSEPDPLSEAPPVAVSILKSGIVDGMAYTLYTDGSIEAELAEGIVRFASIDELRAHLAKSA